MELFVPRKLKFKAWNKHTGLVMRLNTLDCIKGELHKEDHILLQFTGYCDSRGEEIYDMDILLIGMEKHVVRWDEISNNWQLLSLNDTREATPLLREKAITGNRLCSYFETSG